MTGANPSSEAPREPDGGSRWSRAKKALTADIPRDPMADFVIYWLVMVPAIALAFVGNVEVLEVVRTTGGVTHASLIATLLEADGALGAFLAAMLVIRYELDKMWREERERKSKFADVDDEE
jgi:hypothetical protein